MEVHFFVNESERNTIGKVLKNELTVSGTLKKECSILRPSILFSGINPAIYNYAYIPEFGRYYYIGNPVSVRENLWEIPFSVDVLESWKSQIKQQDAIIERQENEYNLYLNDPEWKVYTNKQVLTREFPSGFLDSGNYFLTVVGGYDDITEGSVV